MSIRDDLERQIEGDIADDPETLKKFSRDTSIFERKPSLVVYPKNVDDVASVVKYAAEAKRAGENVSVTARAAGTCMSGGPLNDSIIVSFTKYMGRMMDIGLDPDTPERGYAIAEAGMFYRDFEKATLAKVGMLLPPYPASRELCAIGGMIANNAGGELTLRYGKMERYIKELDVILSDGSRAKLRALDHNELAEKKSEPTLEGTIYRKLDELIAGNRAILAEEKPRVSKNSAGYALWSVFDEERGTFDLTKLIAGSQGTLALVTSARLSLERLKSHHAMLVVFLSDLTILPEVVRRVRKFEPESFESYDDHTFKLAVRYGYEFLKNIGLWQAIKLAVSFLPEARMTMTRGVPKLVLLAEFAEESDAEAKEKAFEAEESLHDLFIGTQIALGAMEAKYWKIRRESFALLRKHVHGLHAAPFIDDIVVHPDDYPKFLPELSTILSKYDIMYTIAGHIGDANFHIIPLIDLGNPQHRKAIMDLTPEVYALVAKYKGSITGEHGDGIIRTPFLHMMFSPKMLELFAETKHIFDPHNILNPGKKVGGTMADLERFMIRGHK